MTALDIPPMQDWQPFERLCRDLWSRLWNDPEAKMHGRSGQAQHGVDVYGRPGCGPEWAGVQCKLKSQIAGSTLTRGQIDAEARKAEKFEPALSTFIVATTASRDTVSQQAEREITDERLARGTFPVSVWAWEDILQALDEHRDLFAKHFSYSLPEGRSGNVRDDYLRAQRSRLLPVPMLGVGRSGDDVPLSAVYTALDVTATIQPGGKGRRHPVAEGGELVGLWGDETYLQRLRARVRKEAEQWKGRQSRRKIEDHSRRLTALEAAAAVPLLVLLGLPGSGKSSFARHLTLCLAGELLGNADANLGHLNPQLEDDDDLPWPHGAVLPVFVELKKLVRHPAFPAEGSAGDAKQLLDYLDATEGEAVGELVRETCAQPGGALLILDGLDETPAAEKYRDRLRQLVSSFTRRYPEARVMVTSRPYAYEQGSSWRLDGAGFEEATLAPFTDAQAKAYVDGWYGLLARRGQVDPDQAERRAQALWRDLSSTAYLRPLAERPLMLSMMSDLHAAGGGRLRGGRAGIYEQSVELLLDRWNQIRDVEEGRSVGEVLGMNVDQLRRAVERLAYEIHREKGAEEESGTAAEITESDLLAALGAERSLDVKVDERRAKDYLHQRSGILFAESPSVYRFPHRSYQEYMAACFLNRTGFPKKLLGEVEADPALWREVVQLAVGKVAPETPYTAWTLLEGLVPVVPPEAVDVGDPRFLRALYAGLAIRENDLWRDVQDQDAPKLERVRQWLQRSLGIEALSPVDRAAAGRVLALLGDQRPGVGLTDDGLPDIDWVKIPGGRFILGPDVGWFSQAKAKEVNVEPFRMSRYPVTNVQYQTFIDDGGYSSKWKSCWTREGWEWKGDREGSQETSQIYLADNHPRVNVSWYEAVAFCRWLSEKLESDVRLPTESEWERAARGTDGRVYPWGEDFDPAKCNSIETGIERTSTVGCFPSGASPEGVLDMSGNVLEWCSTKWRESYEESADEDPEGKASRVLRGGSFAYYDGSARCAVRCFDGPLIADLYVGFRVSAPI